jgi:hypothetical protein
MGPGLRLNPRAGPQEIRNIGGVDLHGPNSEVRVDAQEMFATDEVRSGAPCAGCLQK